MFPAHAPHTQLTSCLRDLCSFKDNFQQRQKAPPTSQGGTFNNLRFPRAHRSRRREHRRHHPAQLLLGLAGAAAAGLLRLLRGLLRGAAVRALRGTAGTTLSHGEFSTFFLL